MRTTLSLAASAIFAGSLMGALWASASGDKHLNLSPLTHAASERVSPDATRWTLYDPDPNHIWNRLYRALYRRESPEGKEYGYDELDPLLWARTKYLLVDPGYRQAIEVLDEFLKSHSERAINAPLKRAILQRDLWAVFDWTMQASGESSQKINLQNKLFEVIRRLALRPEEISGLPDSYDAAIKSREFLPSYDPDKRTQGFLPPELFDPKGPWVMLSARGGQPIAMRHVSFFSGRSLFLIFMRLPGGRAATLDYLKSLDSIRKPWLLDANGPEGVMPNPEVPQFPPGTELALVRKALLIDNEGNLQASNIVEDLQIRVHRTIPAEIQPGLNVDRNDARTALDGFEFKFSRAKLFAGENGGLRAVQPGEKEFALFASHDFEFEQREPLAACPACHFRPGVHSMLSRGRLETGGTIRVEVLPAWDLSYEANSTKWWKGTQYNWGLLQGLWRSRTAN
jgi:hypothetical protein